MSGTRNLPTDMQGLGASGLGYASPPQGQQAMQPQQQIPAHHRSAINAALAGISPRMLQEIAAAARTRGHPGQRVAEAILAQLAAHSLAQGGPPQAPQGPMWQLPQGMPPSLPAQVAHWPMPTAAPFGVPQQPMPRRVHFRTPS